MTDQASSPRYIFRAIIPPFRKSTIVRDIHRVIAPHLEPGENIEICAVFYSGSLTMGYGLIGAFRAVQRNRGVHVYYTAVTGGRVLMAEVSWRAQRPRGLVLDDPRAGASLRRLTNPARARHVYAAVEYRGPSGQQRKLWYDGLFKQEVGHQFLGLGIPEPDGEN